MTLNTKIEVFNGFFSDFGLRDTFQEITKDRQGQERHPVKVAILPFGQSSVTRNLS